MRLRARETGDDKAHASWLELLVDLVFYAVIGQTAMQLGRDPTPHGLWHFALYFLPIWWSWIGLAFFAARFDFDDLRHRAVVFLQTAAFAAMALIVTVPGPAGRIAFAIAYATMRVLLVISYLRAGYVVEEARPLTQRYALGFSAAALFWAISAFTAGWLQLGLWAIGQIVDCATPFLSGTLQTELPPDDKHLPERLGQLVLIILGETVSLTIGSIGAKHLTTALVQTVSIIFLSLVIAWGMWWAYFDSIEEHGGSAIIAASRDGKVGIYQTWLYAHLPLVLGINLTGVATRWALLAPPGRPFTPLERYALCGGFAISLLGVLLVQAMRIQASGKNAHPVSRRAIAFKCLSVVAIILAAFVGVHWSSIDFFVLASAIAVGVVGLNIYARKTRPKPV